jgi:hypothetical protein
MAMNRKQLTTAIHTLKTRHGLPEESYRAQIAQYANGKTSCTDCSVEQLEEILRQLKRQLKSDPRIRKITGLWLSMASNGVVKDKSQRAMRKFCSSFCQLPLEQATGPQLNNMIEALKAMEKRG